MEIEELRHIESTIRELLIAAGLNWVVAAVDESASHGITQDTSADEDSDTAVDTLRRASYENFPSSKAQFGVRPRTRLTNRSLTAEERVINLLSAIECVVELPEIRKETMTRLTEPSQGKQALVRSARFVSDTESVEVVLDMSYEEVEENAVVTNLRELLAELRQEIRS